MQNPLTHFGPASGRLAKLALTGLVTLLAGPVFAATEQPNIMVIWGDDIGITNISNYSRGIMGYTTPNIDRIAEEGTVFTDYYGEQSCTAGRSAFYYRSAPYSYRAY